MLVKISHTDIKYGKKKNCVECPIGGVITRLINNQILGANVTMGRVYFYMLKTGKTLLWKNLPQIAQEFIENFDNDCPVSPFAFELDIPGEFLK